MWQSLPTYVIDVALNEWSRFGHAVSRKAQQSMETYPVHMWQMSTLHVIIMRMKLHAIIVFDVIFGNRQEVGVPTSLILWRQEIQKVIYFAVHKELIMAMRLLPQYGYESLCHLICTRDQY